MVKTPKPKVTVAQFITQQIHVSGKSQKQIAQETGFNAPNVITMLKQGSMQLPLTKVGPLAKSLEVDGSDLMRMAMAEYSPETLAAIEAVSPGLMLTRDEQSLVKDYRQIVREHEAFHEIEHTKDDGIVRVFVFPKNLFGARRSK